MIVIVIRRDPEWAFRVSRTRDGWDYHVPSIFTLHAGRLLVTFSYEPDDPRPIARHSQDPSIYDDRDADDDPD
jgi:hypothetical protein